MNTLVYKRTHTGDPNAQGVFGCHDCMGRVRRRAYEGLARKLTWIGIGPNKTASPDPNSRGPQVTFDRFVLWDENGADLQTVAPRLVRQSPAVGKVCQR